MLRSVPIRFAFDSHCQQQKQQENKQQTTKEKTDRGEMLLEPTVVRSHAHHTWPDKQLRQLQQHQQRQLNTPGLITTTRTTRRTTTT
jgi:hypothetical protein